MESSGFIFIIVNNCTYRIILQFDCLYKPVCFQSTHTFPRSFTIKTKPFFLPANDRDSQQFRFSHEIFTQPYPAITLETTTLLKRAEYLQRHC